MTNNINPTGDGTVDQELINIANASINEMFDKPTHPAEDELKRPNTITEAENLAIAQAFKRGANLAVYDSHITITKDYVIIRPRQNLNDLIAHIEANKKEMPPKDGNHVIECYEVCAWNQGIDTAIEVLRSI